MSNVARFEPSPDAAAVKIVVKRYSAMVFRKLKNGKRSEFFYVKGRLQNGAQFFKCTRCAVQADALKVAKTLFSAALDGELDKLVHWNRPAAVPRIATIGEVIGAHERMIRRAHVMLEPTTAAGYRNMLRRLVAWSRGLLGGMGEIRRTVDVAAVDALPATVLTPGLIDEYVANYLEAAGTSPLRRAAALRSAHTVLRNARALFDRDGMKCYAGLAMPDLQAFMQHQMVEAPRVEHTVLLDSAVAEMATAALALKASNPALYLVHLLCRHCGVRNDELVHMRAEWVVISPRRIIRIADGSEREVAAVLAIVKRDYFDPKGSSGRIAIAPCVWDELRPRIEGREKLEHVVPARDERERKEIIYRQHADFVRPWTRDHQKKGYELRRWGATRVATMHQSDDMAEKFLRHAKRSVAAKHYVPADTVMPAPITLLDCGIRIADCGISDPGGGAGA